MKEVTRKILQELKEEFGGYVAFAKEWDEDYNNITTTDYVILRDNQKHVIVSGISDNFVNTRSLERKVEYIETEKLVRYYSHIREAIEKLEAAGDERAAKLEEIRVIIQPAYDYHCKISPVIVW